MPSARPGYWVIAASVAMCGWLVFCVASGRGSPDPAKWLLHEAGFIALCMLIATLAVSPLRRVTQRPAVAAWRRPFGLAAFAFVCLHVLTYGTVYQGFAWKPILDDVAKRPYILLGLFSFTLLLPMAVTSTRDMRRRLRRRWKQIHRAIYVLVPFAIVHQGMAQKADLGQTLIFSALAGCFLAERAFSALRERVRAKKS